MSETKNIYQKLFELKKEIGKVSKESTNPFFDSKYMDINTLLENVEPLFESYNLMLLQPIENGVVKTQIINLDDLTEEFIESSIELPKDNNPQKIGSAITYFRRYSLKSLLGIQEEDDDGNKSAKPTPVKSKLSEDQFNRLLSSDKKIMKKAFDNYDLDNQQILDLTNKIEGHD